MEENLHHPCGRLPSAAYHNHSCGSYFAHSPPDPILPPPSVCNENSSHWQTHENADFRPACVSSPAATTQNHFGPHGSPRLTPFTQIHHGFFFAQARPYSPYHCTSMQHALGHADNHVGGRIFASMAYDARALSSAPMLSSPPPIQIQAPPSLAPPPIQIQIPRSISSPPVQIQIPPSMVQIHSLGNHSMAHIHPAISHPVAQLHPLFTAYPRAGFHPQVMAQPTAQIIQSISSQELLHFHGNTSVNTVVSSPPSRLFPGSHGLHHFMYPGNHPRKDFNGTMAEKRKKNLTDRDALMKETQDLHCLFRASFAEEQRPEGMLSPKDANNDCVWDAEVHERPWTNSWHDYFARNKDAIDKESKRSRKNDDFQDCEQIEACEALVKANNEGEAFVLETPATSSKEFVQISEATSLKERDKDGKQAPEVKKCVQVAAREKLAELVSNLSDDDENSDGESEDEFYSDSEHERACVSSPRSVKGKEEISYDFFLKLFDENQELTKLYEEQCHVGKFECLVCSTIKGKASRMFNGLTSVVLHATKIQKTKRRPEHRGFGRAICTILGWQRERLPSSAESKNLSPRGCLPQDA